MKKQDILENQVNFAYLALGSNLGDKKNNLNKSIDLIKEEGIFIKKDQLFVFLILKQVKSIIIFRYKLY